MSKVATSAVVGYSRSVTVNCADDIWVKIIASIAKFKREVW